MALISRDKAYKLNSHCRLGVHDVSTHNQALLMKFLYKFYNCEDLLWVKIKTYYSHSLTSERLVGSFWWKSILRLLPTYKAQATCQAGKGNYNILARQIDGSTTHD